MKVMGVEGRGGEGRKRFQDFFGKTSLPKIKSCRGVKPSGAGAPASIAGTAPHPTTPPHTTKPPYHHTTTPPVQADYPIDVGVITVSRGRSLLRDAHHVVLPLAPPASGPAAAPAVISPAELEALRDYLGFVRGLQCQLDEAVAEQLAGAFVEAARGEPGYDMDRFNTSVTVRGAPGTAWGLPPPLALRSVQRPQGGRPRGLCTQPSRGGLQRKLWLPCRTLPASQLTLPRLIQAAPAPAPALPFCRQLAKLLSLSAGQDRFDMSSWARASQLEAQRKQRLAAAIAPRPAAPAATAPAPVPPAGPAPAAAP
jgi:hypothetical protein